MPKVSPLRMLIGNSPKSGLSRQQKKCDDRQQQQQQSDEHSSTSVEQPQQHQPRQKMQVLAKPVRPDPQSTPLAKVKKSGSSSSFATVFPHSENVPENLMTPPATGKGSKAKLSWYQRQVKHLGAGEVQAIPRNPQPKACTPRAKAEREPPLQSLSGTTSSSNVQSAAATPRRLASRSLKYTGDSGATISTQAPYFELEEDSSFWLDHNVQVFIRIRPLCNEEAGVQGSERCIRQESAHSLTWVGTPDVRFTFDHVACEATTQEQLFRVAGMPMIENCIQGYNSSIFAYGQTGSGKTHTMLGDIYRQHTDRGVTPRVFEHLFLRIQMEEDSRRHENLKYTCKCSFLEIHNEQITDLLDPSSTNLQVREDAKRGVYVEGLSEIEVNSVADVTSLLLQGSSNRKVAATNMNRESSRSHSVLTCIIESKWEREAIVNRRYGRLNLVDLAGSERQKASGAESERLKEAANINKSLSTLGLVIMILVDVANGKQRHVPYRDSKLTYLLQDSLGGNSKTMIIATVNPSIDCSIDTLSTLKFGQRAKFICNNAVVNEDTSGDVNALRQQIHKLKEEVNRLRSQSSEASSCVEDEDGVDRVEERKKATPKSKDLSRLLSAEFQKLNQLRESLEAELESSPPVNSNNYRKVLQDSQTENEVLRRRVSELQSIVNRQNMEENHADLKLRTKIENLEQDQERQLKNISHLESLLQNSEESRVEQAANITSLELSLKQYAAQVEELQSQLKEARDVQEQMESQQLFLMSEFEASLEKHNQQSEALKNVETRERMLKDQLRLLKWELKKKDELQDLEKELETRVSAESLVIGYADEEEKSILEAKLRKARKELEEARSRNLAFQGEEASRVAREKQMDITRAEVETETANTIACLNRELIVAKEQSEAASQRATQMKEELEELKLRCQSLTEECSRLRAAYKLVVDERNFEVREWEDTTGKMLESFAEGDQALDAAAKEIEEILQESIQESSKSLSECIAEWKVDSGDQQVELLQAKLHQVFHVAKDAEEKMKALSALVTLDNAVLESQHEGQLEQVREAEKIAHVALEEKFHSRVPINQEWRLEKEELLMELTEAKLEAAAKSRETANVLQKFRDSQKMLTEAETLLNALVRANETAKSDAQEWKDEMRRSMPCLPQKSYLDAKLEKAKGDMAVIKQEVRALKLDTVHAVGQAEREVQDIMRSMEENLKDIMAFVFSFHSDIRDEFLDFREKMQELVVEAASFIVEIRRKNELVQGLEYDISLLQEAFAEAHEKKQDLQEANERMQEELEVKTNEINNTESELFQLLKTLTSAETELRSLKDATTYLTSENSTLREKIVHLESTNNDLRKELEDKKCLVDSLDTELLDLSSLVEGGVMRTPTTGDPELDVVIKERDELHVELSRLREQYDGSRSLTEELELVVAKSEKVAEEYQSLAEEKGEEVKILERSVQELECTIITMENQIGLLKREAEVQRSKKEDLEMELHRVKLELSTTRISMEAVNDSGASICMDKLKLLRLEEELKGLREECRARDAKIATLEKHKAELVELSDEEARSHRKKIKELEASLGATHAQRPSSPYQRQPEKAGAKKSGSPFRCMGLGNTAEMAEELSRNKRRLDELQAMKLARDKEMFLLNSKLAQAESMTYDAVRDLLGVKHEIASFMNQREQRRD